MDADIAKEKVDAIGDWQQGPFNAAERAVLAFADEMAITKMNGTMSSELHEQLKLYFSDGDIVELGFCAGILGGLNKLAFVLNVVEMEDYCPFKPNA